MFFLASSHTKNTKSEKTNKHTIWLIYPTKLFEHILFSKVIIIAFAHKKLLIFYVSVCGLIINFVNLFRQMPVNTRRKMAGL
jgi:hypothetical protein